MPFFFSDPATIKKSYASRVKRIAALAWSLWGEFGKESDLPTERTNDLMSVAPSAEGVAFASHGKKAMSAIVADDWRIGIAMDGAGEARMRRRLLPPCVCLLPWIVHSTAVLLRAGER